MNLRVFAEMLLTDARSKVARLLFDYTQYRYGKRADLCVVSALDGQVIFSTSAINGIEESNIDGDKLCSVIRSKCGQQTLNTYGLVPPGKDMPVLGLLPTPALLKELGLINFVKFIKAWPGESKVGEAVVVKYILWKETNDGLSD